MVDKINPVLDPIEYPVMSLEQLTKLQSLGRVNTPTITSQDKELSARIDETFRDAIEIPAEIAASLGDDSGYAAMNRVVTNGESPSLELLDKYAQPKDLTNKLGQDLSPYF